MIDRRVKLAMTRLRKRGQKSTTVGAIAKMLKADPVKVLGAVERLATRTDGQVITFEERLNYERRIVQLEEALWGLLNYHRIKTERDCIVESVVKRRGRRDYLVPGEPVPEFLNALRAAKAENARSGVQK